MKPYGYKKKNKMIGDGCFYCDPTIKQSKKAKRQEAKNKIKKDIKNEDD